MAFDTSRGVAVVFGGLTLAGYASATLEWNGTNWLKLAPLPGYTGRVYHGMAWDSKRQRVMVFGGERGAGDYWADDLWAWDGTGWTLVATGGPGRNHHTMSYDRVRDRLVVFGGTSPGKILGDTWEWDGSRWLLMAVPPNSPSPRADPVMVYDDARARTVLSGGVELGGTMGQGTWEWDGTRWTQSAAPMDPTDRSAAAMTYDWTRRRVVLFGGLDTNQQILDDTWEYYTPNPATYAPYGTPCAGTAGTPLLQTSPAYSYPWLGDRFELEVTPIPINAAVAWNLGFSKTRWGPLGLPLPLGFLGMGSCTLLASGEIGLPGTTAGTRATLVLPLPASPAHVGLTFYNQAFVLDPGANALGVVASNGGEGTTGLR